jgi:hypothetical protein
VDLKFKVATTTGQSSTWDPIGKCFKQSTSQKLQTLFMPIGLILNICLADLKSLQTKMKGHFSHVVSVTDYPMGIVTKIGFILLSPTDDLHLMKLDDNNYLSLIVHNLHINIRQLCYISNTNV